MDGSLLSQQAAMIEALPCPMYIVGADGSFVATNQSFRDITDLSSDEASVQRDRFAARELYDIHGQLIPPQEWPSL
ncbi:MAG TPA: hypothetical protein VES20_09590, partial [Bryobacteraceae bacterium]|nr:hypothetical protein [Bryobacteraceae bacterium]